MGIGKRGPKIRPIKKIILHCSDTDFPAHDNIQAIRKFHVDERGFSDVGYNYFIRMNGTIEVGRPVHLIPAHTYGHNSDSIGICFSGKGKFGAAQVESCARICLNYLEIFNLTNEDIYPHNFFNKGKTCPNFDINFVKEKILELKEGGKND